MSKAKSNLFTIKGDKDLLLIIASTLLLLANLALCKTVIYDTCISISDNGLRIIVSLIVMYFILRSKKWLLLNKLIELMLVILVVGLVTNILVFYYSAYY